MSSLITHCAAVERKNGIFPGGTVNDFALPASHDLVVQSASGVSVQDSEGRLYQDHLLGSGPLVLGHAHPVVVEAVTKQVSAGTTYYLPNVASVDLAEEIRRWVPSVELLRYCSDGSEAVFYALRIARAATGRMKVLKFEGGFHGHSDYALQGFAPSTSGGFPSARPDTAGVPDGATASMLVAPYNDVETLTSVLEQHRGEVAAIVVEPVQRAIEPVPGFLQAVRRLADEHGCVLVFDEVVTGFRLDMGGAQALFGVIPDLTTFGKSMSGGLPIAAVGGRADLMALASTASQPSGVYMSGTLNGNPLSSAAGLATVREMARIDGCGAISQTGGQIRDGLVAILQRSGLPGCVIGPPAFPEVVFGPTAVTSYSDYIGRDVRTAEAFGFGLLGRGILVRPGTKLYVSAVHTQQHVDRLLETAEAAMVDAVRHVEMQEHP